MTTSVALLPEPFRALEPYVRDWALPTRQQRYDMRLSKTIEELMEFYDTIAPLAEDAIAYLDRLELNDLPEDATRLLHLMYAMVLVSYPVNVFKQPRIPDSGAAFFDTVVEPVV
ncbi:hypothetical protein ACFVT5_08270 [Streptomyces sp. NPDC058001]|uniref:hypothetical protein n=1 Tax=Streptomyces sp. NPDC058001 TaxID=3346300 RepID=UPI0036ED9DAA